MRLAAWLSREKRTSADISDQEAFKGIFSFVMEELRRSGLAGRAFQPEEYAQAIEEYAGLEIVLGNFRDLDNSLLSTKLRELGLVGATLPDPANDRVWMVLPDGLTGLVRREVCFHELSHVACAHVFSARHRLYQVTFGYEEYSCGAEELQSWHAPHKFALGEGLAEARKRMVKDEQRSNAEWNTQELEADLRALALLHASIYGQKIADRPEYFIGLMNERFPRPVGPFSSARRRNSRSQVGMQS
jgi:hypothetical protein